MPHLSFSTNFVQQIDKFVFKVSLRIFPFGFDEQFIENENVISHYEGRIKMKIEKFGFGWKHSFHP